YDLKIPRSFDRVRPHEPRPACHRLTNGSRTGTRSARRGEAAAHESVSAPDDPRFQGCGHQVVEGPEAHTHTSDGLAQVPHTHPAPRPAHARASPKAGAAWVSTRPVHDRSSCERWPCRPTRTRISRTSSHSLTRW